MEILVDFERLPWESPAPGLRQKALVRGGRRARLLDLTEGFVEPGWCTLGHAFSVLDGRCSIETREGAVVLEKGAVGLLAGGEPHAHRLVLGSGERALLLVFDDAPAAPADRAAAQGR